MVVQLATSLAVPLRQVNAMLRAAGHDPLYDESDDALPPSVLDALALLKAHHEPFPLVVVDRTYEVLDLNGGALARLRSGAGRGGTRAAGIRRGSVEPGPTDVRPRRRAAPSGQLRRMSAASSCGASSGRSSPIPTTVRCRSCSTTCSRMPTVDPDWRQVDLMVPSDPALVLHLRTDTLDLRFLTMITAFQAPQNVAVEHLRIETWFPYDAATAEACRAL